MNDYNSLRLKRNAELQEAINNVRKDLYDLPFKVTTPKKTGPPRSNSNHVPPIRLKSLESSSGSLESTKRTESFSAVNATQRSDRPKSENRSTRHKSINSDQNKFKNLSHIKIKKSEPTEFLASFPDESEISDKYEEKMYLSSRSGAHVMTSKRSPNKIEADLILKLNQKNPHLLSEMDLSQFELRNIPSAIKKFKMLRFLDLSCNHLLIIENLEFRGLIELRLFANKISNVDNLDGLPDLQSLQLQANNIKKLNKGISCLRKLEYLRLDHNELESISHQEISPCLNLIYLNVSQNKLDNLNFINYLPNLEELDASNNKLKKLDGIDTNRCKKLTEINLSHNYLTDDKLSVFENLLHLQTLKISNNALKSVKSVSSLNFLKDLDVSCNEIENIEYLAQLKDLETLDVSGNRINDPLQIECLVKCSQLVELQIAKNPVSEKNSEAEITHMLPNLKFLNNKKLNEDPQKNPKKPSLTKGMTFLNVDFLNNQQEVDMISQSLITRFNEIKQTLDAIPLPVNPKTTDIISNVESNVNTPIRIDSPISHFRKTQSAKNRLIDALNFSKNLDS